MCVVLSATDAIRHSGFHVDSSSSQREKQRTDIQRQASSNERVIGLTLFNYSIIHPSFKCNARFLGRGKLREEHFLQLNFFSV